jgi:hypothetical protein
MCCRRYSRWDFFQTLLCCWNICDNTWNLLQQHSRLLLEVWKKYHLEYLWQHMKPDGIFSRLFCVVTDIPDGIFSRLF